MHGPTTLGDEFLDPLGLISWEAAGAVLRMRVTHTHMADGELFVQEPQVTVWGRTDSEVETRADQPWMPPEAAPHHPLGNTLLP